MRRHQDFWLWAGGALSALALTLVAVAGGLLAARDHYQFWGSAPMIVAYVCGALALCCFAAAVRDVPFPFGRVDGTPERQQVQQESPSEIPVPDMRESARGWRLVKAPSHNDNHFPRIESAVDSFGDKAGLKPSGDPNSLWSHSMRVVRPGQQVSFELEVSDPNGEDVAVRVLCGSGEAQVAISPDGTIAWSVEEQNIADPAYVHIYARSQRTFHRFDGWDATASWVYRVLPRLAPKVQS